MKKFNVIDLFCGCGGFSKGFEEAGFNICFGIDMKSQIGHPHWAVKLINFRNNLRSDLCTHYCDRLCYNINECRYGASFGRCFCFSASISSH